jgi:hypothetical protein
VRLGVFLGGKVDKPGSTPATPGFSTTMIATKGATQVWSQTVIFPSAPGHVSQSPVSPLHMAIGDILVNMFVTLDA